MKLLPVSVVLYDMSTNPPTTRPFPSLNQLKRFLNAFPNHQFSRYRHDPETKKVGWRYKGYAIVVDNPTPEQIALATYNPGLFGGVDPKPGRPGTPCWAHPVGEESSPEARQWVSSVSKLAAFLDRSVPGVYVALRDRLEEREALAGELAARMGDFWIGYGGLS